MLALALLAQGVVLDSNPTKLLGHRGPTSREQNTLPLALYYSFF